MGVKRATRVEDEVVLQLLAARMTAPSAVVAAQFGISDVAVRVSTNRVVSADLDESGEPRHAVLAHYQFHNSRSL